MPASNGAINGKVFLLQVSGTTVAHSRDMTVTQTRNEIDASDKDDDEEVVLPGRATREVAMQASYVTGDTQREALQTAFDAGTEVAIKVMNTDDATEDRTANATVLDMTETFPDQGLAVYDVRLKLAGGWS